MGQLAGRNDQVILVNTECLVCMTIHDIQVDRIQRDLCQDTGKDRWNTKLGM